MSKDRVERRSLEEKIAAVDKWIDLICGGVVESIDRRLLREVFETYGAEFEQEAGWSLRRYTQKDKAPGMRLVWGERFAEYKKWVKEYIKSFEASPANRELPKLLPSGRKNSGMIQFFGELTAFAAGAMSLERFKKLTQARAENGLLWQLGKGGERIRLKVPTAKEPILLPSFPPGFPRACWGKIKSWKINTSNFGK